MMLRSCGSSYNLGSFPFIKLGDIVLKSQELYSDIQPTHSWTHLRYCSSAGTADFLTTCLVHTQRTQTTVNGKGDGWGRGDSVNIY